MNPKTEIAGAYVQWMYNVRGNREAAWRRREAKGEKVDRESEAFSAGWRAALQRKPEDLADSNGRVRQVGFIAVELWEDGDTERLLALLNGLAELPMAGET